MTLQPFTRGLLAEAALEDVKSGCPNGACLIDAVWYAFIRVTTSSLLHGRLMGR
jgi:hypothetical protein